MTESEVWVGGDVTLVADLAFVQVSVKPTENALDDPSGLVEEAAVRLLRRAIQGVQGSGVLFRIDQVGDEDSVGAQFQVKGVVKLLQAGCLRFALERIRRAGPPERFVRFA